MKNKIRVLFDANPIAADRLTGVGHYEKRLIESLAANKNLMLIGYYYDFLGRKKAKQLPKSDNIKYKRIIFYPGALVNLLRRYGIEIPVEFLAKTKADIALFPNYLSHPSIFGAKILPVVHDLTHEFYPQYMSPKNQQDLYKFLPKTLERSAACVAVSQTTKKDLIKIYGYQKTVTVTPIPFEPKGEERIIPKSQLIKKFDIKNNYILFVGTIEPRKNIINLVDAYMKLSDGIKSEYALVLAGGNGWKNEEIIEAITKAQEAGENIIKTGYISDKEKSSLYTHASLFVLPSHYEGFGMPVLEAMQYNVPCAISDIEVFHEIANDAAVYFDKDSPIDISNKINEVLANKLLGEGLAQKGKQNLSKYSWDDNAKVVVESIEHKLKKANEGSNI